MRPTLITDLLTFHDVFLFATSITLGENFDASVVNEGFGALNFQVAEAWAQREYSAGHVVIQLCPMTRISEFVPTAGRVVPFAVQCKKAIWPLVEGRMNLNLNIPVIVAVLLTTLIAQAPRSKAVLRRKRSSSW